MTYCTRVVTVRDSRAVNKSTDLPAERDHFYGRASRSVPAARRFARQSLEGWGLAGWARSADVSLCVSELVTNAVRHGVPRGRGLRLRLRYDRDLVRVEVHDSGGGVPRVQEEPDEGGRGLLLVSVLADKWGVGERSPGKVVWCEFEVGGEGAGPGVTPPGGG
ncbi:ATP-binding protein [Streptomyces sp. NPDC091281]|uniref:ATP-binding protein n=1 Tax=Streptomyces sp. NPDC091281 TaxID=3365985 RepID=UPI0037FC6BD9